MMNPNEQDANMNTQAPSIWQELKSGYLALPKEQRPLMSGAIALALSPFANFYNGVDGSAYWMGDSWMRCMLWLIAAAYGGAALNWHTLSLRLQQTLAVAGVRTARGLQAYGLYFTVKASLWTHLQVKASMAQAETLHLMLGTEVPHHWLMRLTGGTYFGVGFVLFFVAADKLRKCSAGLRGA